MFTTFVRSVITLTLLVMFGVVVGISIGRSRPLPESLKFIDYLICNLNNCVSAAADESMSRSAIEYRHLASEQAQYENGSLTFDFYSASYSRRRAGALLDGTRTLFVVVSTKYPGLNTLGDFMAYYGEPCAVTITEANVALQFPDFYMIVAETDNLSYPIGTSDLMLSPLLRVSIIRLMEEVFSCENPVIFSMSNTVSDWHGFRSLAFYVSNSRNP